MAGAEEAHCWSAEEEEEWRSLVAAWEAATAHRSTAEEEAEALVRVLVLEEVADRQREAARYACDSRFRYRAVSLLVEAEEADQVQALRVLDASSLRSSVRAQTCRRQQEAVALQTLVSAAPARPRENLSSLHVSELAAAAVRPSSLTKLPAGEEEEHGRLRFRLGVVEAARVGLSSC